MVKGLFFTLITFNITTAALASTKSICGESDDRVLSFDPKIGRLSVEEGNRGCTVTMISDRCGITAGHCEKVLVKAEFNTPISVNNQPMPSAKKDTYYIDVTSIVMENDGPGKDWALVKFLPNKITKKYPGQVQGYYDVTFAAVRANTTVAITGYGKDDGDLTRNFAQQIHEGKIIAIGDRLFGETVLKHTVDTMGGNSGSTIINASTNKVIGIHTHGGCDSPIRGFNMGTSIARHQELQKAIRKCLASDR